MAVILRPAVADDQIAITAIIRAALLNPFGLDWRRFLVAEESGGLIGIGQVKPHRDGTRELASIAVIPEWQGAGVGQAIVLGLLARETGPLYLMCAYPNRAFYRRFGFYEIEPAAMPSYFRRMARMAALLSRMLANQRWAVAIMRRDAQP